MKHLLLGCLVAGLTCLNFAQDQKPNQTNEPKKLELSDTEKIFLAVREGEVDTVKKLVGDSKLTHHKLGLATAHQNRGQKRFFDANIKGSIEDFDAYLEVLPENDPQHWQRGISYYYAERFADGKAQFERHQTYNSQDVENAVWHFICSVKAPEGSVEKARKSLIPITQDTRVPMKEVHKLFAGTGTAEAVLAAAQARSNQNQEVARNAMLYAHLYLGLYYEATGELELMKQHIAMAAGKFKMEHYMGKVAQVHAKLRGIATE